MTDTTTESGIDAQLNNPSWFDRFTDWVENLPVRGWVFYFGLGLLLNLIQMLFLWLDGGLQAQELLPIIIFNGWLTPFVLALIHFLDNEAAAALHSTRSILDMSEPEFDQYEYRLANMPFLPPLIAGLAMTVFVLLMERVSTLPVRYATLEQLPVFSVVYHIVDKSTAFLFGVIIYHTIRQLRLVNTINSTHIRINLFHMGPIQAFSRLTASTAVGLVLGIYGWMLINPDLMSDPLSLAFVISFTIMAGAVFAWPLYGAHRLMEMEKQRMLHEIDLQFEALFAKFNQRLRDDDHVEIERLNGTISSLEIQHRKIKAIPTWPWRPETVRTVLTVIAIPLVVSILQVLIQQAFAR
jgi:hypothetical protein